MAHGILEVAARMGDVLRGSETTRFERALIVALTESDVT